MSKERSILKLRYQSKYINQQSKLGSEWLSCSDNLNQSRDVSCLVLKYLKEYKNLKAI